MRFVLGLAAPRRSKISVDTMVQDQRRRHLPRTVFTFYDTIFNAASLLATMVAVLAVPPSSDQPWGRRSSCAALFLGTAAVYRPAGLSAEGPPRHQ